MSSVERKRDKSTWPGFLKDVFLCSMGAYGGPEAHYGVFTDQLVIKGHYLSEEELMELIALTGILPGPSSTQTIVAIGYKHGGPLLALLTMLVWALPVLSLMTVLSFLGQFLDSLGISQAGLRYIGPMAVAFILSAAFRLGRKAARDALSAGLLLAGAVSTYFMREAWIYPLALLLGGVLSIAVSKERNLGNRVRLNPPWAYLSAFAAILVASLVLTLVWDTTLVHIFESFYRYGYLVIGGGQVVVPLMHSELVETRGYLSSQEFMTGFGLVQGLPGPMFSFSAYAGGLAARGSGILHQLAGALAAGIGIFLPGILLIYFVYPVWEGLKRIKAIKVSLRGVIPVAAGLICASGAILLQENRFALDTLLVTALSMGLLLTKKVPAPLLVAAAIAAGFMMPA